jgi:hypothetical protein
MLPNHLSQLINDFFGVCFFLRHLGFPRVLRTRRKPRQLAYKDSTVWSISGTYCGYCLILVTRSPLNRTKTVLEGGWP